MKILRALWRYMLSMNSEPGAAGGISIKRNSAWAVVMLLLFVEVFSLVIMDVHRASWRVEVRSFTDLCRFYAGLDVVFILLVLQITSVEKLVAAWQCIKGANGAAGAAVSSTEKEKAEV